MTPSPVRMLRLAEVRELTGLGTTTIYKLMSEGEFPSQRRLHTRAVAWLSTDLEAWMQSRPPVHEVAA